MDIAANLDLATAKALTDLHQYINSDLVFSDLKFGPFIVKNSDRRGRYTQWTKSGLEQILLLATAWSLYQAEIHLI